MNKITATYTDQYQLTMAEVYFLNNRHCEPAVFDYFYRKNPFKGGYSIFTGLENLLTILEDFKFSSQDIDFLNKIGLNSDFLEYLKTFKFTGTIKSVKEGEVIFPTEPVLSVSGTILEVQLIETVLLNILNFQSLIACKASRIRHAAGKRTLIDFGLRRAQATGAYFASRAAYIGGFNATSNVVAGKDFDIPVSGTMAHAFVQSYGNEIEAFRAFAEKRPTDCVLLVDTYDTLKSGVPNAIIIAKEMETKGYKLKGIRLDSGDLAYLSRKARKMLDNEGLEYVKISASNQLDENLIMSLNRQGAKIDVFGIGTSFITGQPDAALDGVFKLAHYKGEDRIKLSDSSAKITIPGKKELIRLTNEANLFAGDVICVENETNPDLMFHPFEPLKKMSIKNFKKEKLTYTCMSNGNRTLPPRTIKEIAEYNRERIEKLPEEHKRFEFPHIYKVGLSNTLNTKRNNLISQHSF